MFFSDAVFAIAITLLVIDLRLPEAAERLSNGQLVEELLTLGPRYYGFVVSFVVIGLYWAGHHLTFGRFVRYDPGLPYVNLPLLFCVAFMPFPTAVLGENYHLEAAVIFYALWQVATGVAGSGLWLWATRRRRLVSADVSDDWIEERTWFGWVPAVAFLVSIPLALVSPILAQLSWWPAVALLTIVVARRFERPESTTEESA
jgi:uncharacterized membrane protein